MNIKITDRGSAPPRKLCLNINSDESFPICVKTLGQYNGPAYSEGGGMVTKWH